MLRYYQKEDRQLVAVDCIIFGFDAGKLKLLLLKRNFEPGKGKWSLAGGFLKKKESLDESAERVLYELTGLHQVYLEQLTSYGLIDRDPGERVISIIMHFSIYGTMISTLTGKMKFAGVRCQKFRN